MSRFIDLTNQDFGNLSVISYAGKNKSNGSMWLCHCGCGNDTVVSSDCLRRQVTVSCGCIRNKLSSERATTHGMSKTKLYHTWKNMKKRCENPNATRYERYGGRGIKVCEEWRNDFMEFYAWAMANGYQEGLTIDRKDNDKGYYPDNCRWETSIIQNQNKGIQSSNKSGIKGVSMQKRTGKWIAQIGVDNKIIYLGIFEDIEKAKEARAQAEKKYMSR